MNKSRKHSDGYADQFKPAIVLGQPTAEAWAQNFFLTEMQESFDELANPRLHSGVLMDSPALNSVYQLTTPVSGFRPLFRDVEIEGKADYQAFLMSEGADDQGVALVMVKPSNPQRGPDETYVNIRILPYATYAALVRGVAKSGLPLLALPDTDIAKLNLTLRPTTTGETIYRTHKTELLFEDVPEARLRDAERRLNLVQSQIVASVFTQALSAMGAWPALSVELADVALACCGDTAKRVVATVFIGLAIVAEGVAATLAFVDQEEAAIVVGAGGAVSGAVGGLVATYIGTCQGNAGGAGAAGGNSSSSSSSEETV